MARRLCRICGKHPAKYWARGGRVRSRRDHDVCFECHRALVNWLRQVDLPPRLEESADG